MGFFGFSKDQITLGSGADEQIVRWDGGSALQGSGITIDDAGSLLWVTDGTVNLGAIGSHRPKRGFIKQYLRAGDSEATTGILFAGSTGLPAIWALGDTQAIGSLYLLGQTQPGGAGSGEGGGDVVCWPGDGDGAGRTGVVRPQTDNKYDLGINSGGDIFRFKSGYFTTLLEINGTSFDDTDIGNWNTAYGWGDHAGLYAPIAHASDTTNPHNVTATQVGKDTAQWNADEIQSVTVTAPVSGDDGEFLRYNYNAGSPTLTWEAAAGGGGDLWSDPVDANIVPATGNTYNLGSSGSKFQSMYLNFALWGTDFTLYSTGGNAYLEPLSSRFLWIYTSGKGMAFDNSAPYDIRLYSDMRPNANGGTDLGTSSYAFGNVYLNTALYVGANQVVGAQQAAEADVGAMTTAGANTGTAGAGLSLIGDTSSSDQSGAIMNDLKALQEDVTALRTTLNSLLAKLRDNSGSGHGLLSD